MYLLAPVAYPALRSRCANAELSILNGALELGAKSVVQLMTPMRDVVTLADDTVLNDGLTQYMLLVKKPSISCFQTLDHLCEQRQTGRVHLLLISCTPERPGGTLRVVTLEADVIEGCVRGQHVQRVACEASVCGGLRACEANACGGWRRVAVPIFRSATEPHAGQRPLASAIASVLQTSALHCVSIGPWTLPAPSGFLPGTPPTLRDLAKLFRVLPSSSKPCATILSLPSLVSACNQLMLSAILDFGRV
ncbi:hypothetical protein GGX14DRAFT_660978 [Mycena pura]|uniref:Uncharacterized protein n=1 Tax=Mycena pura TaxID=153505 RepID=A0AAD6V8I7_9AGAR|nr:hypothetical protein GGX14DRAFT_660978 [Mycena pura]